MPKSPKPKSTQPQGSQPRAFYAAQPWRCVHHPDRTDITAYVEASGERETVATIHPSSGARAEDIASFVANLVNAHQQNRHLLHDVIDALEAVMSEGMTYSTEQDLDAVLKRLKRTTA
jgi:hypothetical protein